MIDNGDITPKISSPEVTTEIGALNDTQRVEDLKNMADRELDVLVIGGGIVGGGAALDAASRGLRVGIVEARDWGSGTSSRSSKLIHGGLRYLEMFDFKLVFEALKERGLLMKTIAPHLVKPITFLYPLQKRIWERLYVGAGIMLYDFLAFLGGNKTKSLKWHKHYSKKGAHQHLPGLKKHSLIGAIRYSDGQVDDARLTLSAVRTAVQYGAKAANQAEVTELIKRDGAVIGAKVHDKLTGEVHEIFAKKTILAAGVWTEDVEAADDSALKVHASKGIHLVIEKDKLQGDSGILLRTEKSVLFIIPWRNFWIIGTTDTPWTLQKEHPAVNREDVKYLLDQVNDISEQQLTEDDIIGIYAGLRPLVSATKTQTTKISREHSINESIPNLYSIAGGKLTTYRIMAKDVVDAAVEGLTKQRSRTEDLPLIGAQESAGFDGMCMALRTEFEQLGLNEDDFDRMINRYGDRLPILLTMMQKNPEYSNRLTSNADYVFAEVAYAVTHEGANHLDDILTRRTRIYMESADRGIYSVEEVAELMATLLKWDAQRTAKEVENYLARVKYERLAQKQLTDSAAEEMRLQALNRE